ncbi:MAG: hypothetical protein Kow00121_18300 [Elainellaceae cyanobacterium]
MSNDAIEVVLIGCGAVSQLYYGPALKELENQRILRVSALFDPNPNNLAQLHRTFPDASCISDLKQLTQKRISLAIVASPPAFHAQQTIELLQAGLSVLCEKPMAATVAEAETMIAAATTAPGKLAIGLFRRFFPATQTIHKIVSEGMLGEIQSFYFSEGGQFQWPVQSPLYFQKAIAQGGVLLDIGVHLLDLMLWWFGEPDRILYEDDAMGGIEVNCRLQCQFAGFSGEVRLSRDCALPNSYLIRGSKGWLKWTANEADQIQLGFSDFQLALDSQIHTLRAQTPLPELGQPSFNFEQSFTSQMCNVIAAMRQQEPLKVPGQEGIRSLRWIEHCYQNRMLMPMPWLSPTETARAQFLNTV